MNGRRNPPFITAEADSSPAASRGAAIASIRLSPGRTSISMRRPRPARLSMRTGSAGPGCRNSLRLPLAQSGARSGIGPVIASLNREGRPSEASTFTMYRARFAGTSR